MRVNKFKVALATVLAVAATAASAGVDNSQSIAVSTSVNSNCVVSSGATLSFAAYDPVSANATTPGGDLAGTGSFSLKCTKGSTTVVVGLGLGANAGAGTQRKMKDTVSGDLLSYNLFQPSGAALSTCPSATAWDDSAAKLNVPTAFWTSSASKTISVCGTVPGAQDVSAGSYSDTVVIDVTF